jgi:hypothetical protein
MQGTQGETGFVFEVRPTTKVAYVSVGVLTKNQVSFNPNPPKLPRRSTQFSLSIPMKRRPIQTFWDFTTILGSSRVTPSFLGEWIHKSNKHNEVIQGEGEVLLLEGGTLKEGWIFSQESRMKFEVLEREGAQALDLNECSHFSEWPTTQGGSWGSIYSPHLKIAVGGIFHQTSPVNLSGVRWNVSRSRSLTGMSGGTLWSLVQSL